MYINIYNDTARDTYNIIILHENHLFSGQDERYCIILSIIAKQKKKINIITYYTYIHPSGFGGQFVRSYVVYIIIHVY